MKIIKTYVKNMYFTDRRKRFDCVDHDTMWLTLRIVGIPEHLIDLIRSLHTKQEALNMVITNIPFR